MGPCCKALQTMFGMAIWEFLKGLFHESVEQFRVLGSRFSLRSNIQHSVP